MGNSSMTTPVRQMIDHSKLVPLLTKTIQELEQNHSIGELI